MVNKNLKQLDFYKKYLNKYYQTFNAYKTKVLDLSNDSLEKTIAIALSLCVVCAVLVSLSSVALRPLQTENKALDMKRNILDVAGLLDEYTDINDAFSSKIEEKLVNIESGDYVSGINISQYDQRKASKDSKQNIIIPRSKDIAGIKVRAKIAKIYLIKQNNLLKLIILPVHGYGLWSTMYGFLALEADAQTVKSISFYSQAETPGLGGEVVNPNWRALWQGKKVYNIAGEPVLRLIKGVVTDNRPESKHTIDGLAGATLTSNGVNNLIKYWLGADGFATYLNKIRTKG